VEAAIIISVLLSFVQQLMTTGKASESETSTLFDAPRAPGDGEDLAHPDARYVLEDPTNGEQRARTRKLLRRMRIQIWAGTLAGFIIALAIGAAFIAVVSGARRWPGQRRTPTCLLIMLR
jgi:high-affinity iron transporter